MLFLRADQPRPAPPAAGPDGEAQQAKHQQRRQQASQGQPPQLRQARTRSRTPKQARSRPALPSTRKPACIHEQRDSASPCDACPAATRAKMRERGNARADIIYINKYYVISDESKGKKASPARKEGKKRKEASRERVTRLHEVERPAEQAKTRGTPADRQQIRPAETDRRPREHGDTVPEKSRQCLITANSGHSAPQKHPPVYSWLGLFRTAYGR